MLPAEVADAVTSCCVRHFGLLNPEAVLDSMPNAPTQVWCIARLSGPDSAACGLLLLVCLLLCLQAVCMP
jgi:hypothetical protein